VAAPDTDVLGFNSRLGKPAVRKIYGIHGAYLPADTVPVAGFPVYLKYFLHIASFPVHEPMGSISCFFVLFVCFVVILSVLFNHEAHEENEDEKRIFEQ
jgi:hypothetical protein